MACSKERDIKEKINTIKKENVIQNLNQFKNEELYKLKKLKKKIILTIISEALKIKKDHDCINQLLDDYKKCDEVENILKIEVKTLIKSMEE